VILFIVPGAAHIEYKLIDLQNTTHEDLNLIRVFI